MRADRQFLQFFPGVNLLLSLSAHWSKLHRVASPCAHKCLHTLAVPLFKNKPTWVSQLLRLHMETGLPPQHNS